MHRIFVAILLSILANCTAKAYPGNELPDTETSEIIFSTSGKVSILSSSTNGVASPALATSVRVLPGEQSVEVSFRYETSERCVDEDYCYSDIIYGKCNGSLSTLPGRSYLITIIRKDNYVRGSILAKGYYDFSVREDEADIGNLFCEEDRF